MKRKFLTVIIIIAITFISMAQEKFTIEQIMSAPFPTNLTASPVGDKVAWIFNAEGVRNIWIAEAPDFLGRRVTDYKYDDGQALSSLAFTMNGEALIYVRGGNANRQGEIPNPLSLPAAVKQEIYMIPIAGGKARLVSEGRAPALSPNGKQIAFLKKRQVWIASLDDAFESRQLFSIRGRPNSLRWSPDSSNQKLAFVSSRGDHSFIGVYDFASNKIKYLDPSVDRDQSPVWSLDGKRIAYIRMPNERQRLPFMHRREALPWSIRVADASSGEGTEVWKAKDGSGSAFRGISANNPLFWGYGDQIVFPWEGDGWTHLYSVPVNGGEATLLTPGPFEVQFVTMSPDRKVMLYSSNQSDIDRQHVWKVPVSGGPPMPVTNGNGIEWASVKTAKTGVICILASGARRPAHPYRLDPSGKMIAMAADMIPTKFPEKHLVKPEQIVFSAADGMKIHGQLFLPENHKKTRKYPAILFFHGGSRRQMLLGFHHRGYYHNAYGLNQYLASQGYIVLSVNFRSGIGYGMEFREALNYGARGASEFNDVMGAGLYLRNRSDVDPDKIGLWGGSYGGYLTALGLARASDLFAAGVDLHGVHDWNIVIRNFTPTYDAGSRQEAARIAFESSPMAAIQGWRSPVLLIHGDDDRNVPFSETVDLVESLRKQGVYFEQLIFPDEVHGFLLHSHWLEAYHATADFFNRMLK